MIIVAQEGGITRAAKTRLFIAPGSLARDIRNLEKRLGYLLFVRKSGGVELTPAGRVFVEEAKKSLDHSQRAADRGAAASRGEIGILNVGLTPFLDTTRLVAIREQLAAMMPEVTLNFHSAYCGVQVGLILRETLDAGLIVLPTNNHEVAVRRLWQTKLVVAIPEGSDVSAPGPIALSELSGVAAVWLAREVNPALYDRLRETCQRGGCTPNVVREALTYDEMLDAISSGVGVGFVKESTADRMRVRGVTFRELRDVQVAIEFGIVYRPDRSCRALQTLLNLLTDMSKCDGTSSSDLRTG